MKDLIWAADLLRVLHDNLRLLVIGDGPERSMLERFASLASDLDHIRFLGHRDDVWRIMPHLDVLWNGSGYEGQSNAVMEAMAAGVPVVASDIPANRELVVHGETGFLVPIAGRAAARGRRIRSSTTRRSPRGSVRRPSSGCSNISASKRTCGGMRSCIARFLVSHVSRIADPP